MIVILTINLLLKKKLEEKYYQLLLEDHCGLVQVNIGCFKRFRNFKIN